MHANASKCIKCNANDANTNTNTNTNTNISTYVDINNITLAQSFARFWEAYPKKKGKADAEKAFKKVKVPVEDLLQEAAQRGENALLVICAELSDPHNLGAIIRTADGAGAHGVIIPKRRAVGLTDTVAKASAGAVEHMKVARVVNLSRTIEELKERNIWTLSLIHI